MIGSRDALIRTALRAYPLRGGYRTIGKRFRRLSPSSEQVVPLRCGPQIYVDPRDRLGSIIYWMGDSDPRITELCLRLLRPGDTALDLGANCGVEALAMAKAVGSRGRVVSCEPNPRCAACLRKSVALNGLTQLELREVAVTDHDGIVSFETTSDSAAGHVGGSGSLTVSAVNAAALFSELAPIRLVKMDVEGHEAVILKSAEHAIAASPPPYILFESQPRAPFWEREEVKILHSLDYDFSHISRNLFGRNLIPVSRDHEPAWGIDFIAMHRSGVD